MKTRQKALSITAIVFFALSAGPIRAQRGDGSSRGRGTPKPVTVPVTIKLRGKPEEMQTVDLLVKEDGEVQQNLSIRRPDNPISLAILLQDDLVSSIGTETKGIANFVHRLPNGSRVMIGYIRSGSLDVRRKFTSDLERAASGLRPPLGLASAGAFNPYVEVIEALRRFDSQPAGRRALILVSDGLDVSRGLDSSAPTQSLDLQRAITEAQRRSVAVYSIYAPSAAFVPQLFAANGQSCLEKLSDETGGAAFFQGTGAPVSFDPFLREIDASLGRQIALTYLSTHTRKGFHRLEIKSIEPNFEVRAPAGFPR